MNEFMNWNDSWILIQHNWIWLLAAFCLGAFVGFRTCDPVVQPPH
jgi:hypothetical protein